MPRSPNVRDGWKAALSIPEEPHLEISSADRYQVAQEPLSLIRNRVCVKVVLKPREAVQHLLVVALCLVLARHHQRLVASNECPQWGGSGRGKFGWKADVRCRTQVRQRHLPRTDTTWPTISEFRVRSKVRSQRPEPRQRFDVGHCRRVGLAGSLRSRPKRPR